MEKLLVATVFLFIILTTMVAAPFDQQFAQIGASDTCGQQWTYVSELLRDAPCGGASLVSA